MNKQWPTSHLRTLVRTVGPKCLLLLVLLAASLLLYRCSPDQLEAAETLERQVLITWIALERGEAGTALQYAENVHSNWRRLRKTYGQFQLNQEEQRFIALLDLWTSHLLSAVQKEQNGNALMAISLIQEELQRTRPRYGLQHPADDLYAFFHSWEDVVAASNDQMMCLYEWQEFEEAVDLAIRQWQTYQANHPRFMDSLFPGYGKRRHAKV